jgi:hypothetical protein
LAEDRVRVEVAFDGGQVLAVIVDAQASQELERALEGGGEGSYPLEAEDGLYTVALRKVVYVKRFKRESRVGFTTS